MKEVITALNKLDDLTTATDFTAGSVVVKYSVVSQRIWNWKKIGIVFKMKLVLLLSLIDFLNAIVSNRTRAGNLFIFEEHPRGKRAVLVNNEPNEPCRIYGHRYHG